jgi:hypothetical protein
LGSGKPDRLEKLSMERSRGQEREILICLVMSSYSYPNPYTGYY